MQSLHVGQVLAKLKALPVHSNTKPKQSNSSHTHTHTLSHKGEGTACTTLGTAHTHTPHLTEAKALHSCTALCQAAVKELHMCPTSGKIEETTCTDSTSGQSEGIERTHTHTHHTHLAKVKDLHAHPLH